VGGGGVCVYVDTNLSHYVNIIEKLELLCFTILYFLDSGSALTDVGRKNPHFMWYSADSA
jgi:hypothetical protein